MSAGISVAFVANTSDGETGAGGSILSLLVLAAIVALIIFIVRRNTQASAKRRAEQAAGRIAEVTDLLKADRDAPRFVIPVTVPLTYVDKKGVRREQWSPRTLALSARHLIIFDAHGNGRETLNLADVVTTSTAYSHLTITISTGATYRFGLAREMLVPIEQDIRQLAAWNRDGNTGSTGSVADELAKLADLRTQGVIDAGDWERAKDLYLGKTEDARQRAARELRQVHELHQSGVLSASEFNMKKWDILARSN